MTTRIDIAFAKLREAILEQVLSPGTKLPEDIIGSHFGISRTLARAALMRLSAEGLVDIRPRQSATVASPTVAEAKEIFAVRRGLERQVIELAAARWSPKVERDLLAHVQAEDEAMAREPAVSIRLAGEFHVRLAQAAGNRLLTRYVTEVVSRCSLILALYGRAHSSECAVSEHRELIASLAAGDRAAAVAFMERHLSAVEDRALFKSEDPDGADLATLLARRFPKPF